MVCRRIAGTTTVGCGVRADGLLVTAHWIGRRALNSQVIRPGNKSRSTVKGQSSKTEDDGAVGARSMTDLAAAAPPHQHTGGDGAAYGVHQQQIPSCDGGRRR